MQHQPPEAIYNSLPEYLELNPGNGSVQIIYPGTRLSKRAKNPPVRFPLQFEAGYVGVILNGRVWGKNGAIIAPNDQLIWDVSLEWVQDRRKHSIFQQDQLPAISQHLDVAVDVTHVGSRNYYHWMFEVLPRVHLWRQSGWKAAQFIIKYEPEHAPFQVETLAHLGISEDEIIRTDHLLHVQAEQLVVPSQPSFATKWGYDFLRTAFLPEKQAISPCKRIYISRKKRRRILNENELMDFLACYGFVKVELETMTVAEQVGLFSTAETIVAPHGAGLANLVFCRPKTKVVEIFPSTYIQSLYWVISSFGELDYRYFIGSGESDSAVKKWSGTDNITINIKKFGLFFKKIGLRPQL